MGAPIRTRPAEAGDYDALTALLREIDHLHAELMPGFFRKTNRPSKSREELERILRSPDESLQVAAGAKGEVLGLVHVQLYDTPPVAVMVPKRRAHIDNLVVARSARRRGVGRRLVEVAASWAHQRGAEEVLLTVWAGNEEAERFYRALGFQTVNTVLALPV